MADKKKGKMGVPSKSDMMNKKFKPLRDKKTKMTSGGGWIAVLIGLLGVGVAVFFLVRWLWAGGKKVASNPKVRTAALGAASMIPQVRAARIAMAAASMGAGAMGKSGASA